MGNTSSMHDCCSGPKKGEIGVDENIFGRGPKGMDNLLSQLKYVEKSYPVGTYKGQMLHNQRCGYGVCHYNSGPIYKGNWFSDRCHGEGIFIDDVSTYSGQWKSGKKHGYGEEIWNDDNTKYIGQHIQGNKSGKGQYLWQDDSCYDGHFENDVVQGEGVLKDAEGGIYEGQFKNNMQHGYGIYRFKNTVYQGQWEETLKHGYGRLEDGKWSYEGGWIENVMDGEGVEEDVQMVTDLKSPKKGQTCPIRMKVWYKKGEKVQERKMKDGEIFNGGGKQNGVIGQDT